MLKAGTIQLPCAGARPLGRFTVERDKSVRIIQVHRSVAVLKHH